MKSVIKLQIPLPTTNRHHRLPIFLLSNFRNKIFTNKAWFSEEPKHKKYKCENGQK